MKMYKLDDDGKLKDVNADRDQVKIFEDLGWTIDQPAEEVEEDDSEGDEE